MAEEEATASKPASETEHIAIDVDDGVETTQKGTPKAKKMSSFSSSVKGSVSRAKQYIQASSTSRVRSFSDRYDDNLLHRAVADAGRWSYGILLAEVWVLNDEHTTLFRPESGWWIDPVYHRECGPACQICRLTNCSRSDYIPPKPLAPGEGLPGALWAEVGRSSRQSRRNSTFRSDPSAEVFGDFVSPANTVFWREVKALAADPDQPWNPRLQLLAELGLGWAAAVPFGLPGAQGITIYMARESVDLSRLQAPTNEAYLVSASNLIGAAYAFRGPRRTVASERRDEMQDAIQRIKRKIIYARRMGISLEQIVKDEEKKKMSIHEHRQEKTSRVGKIFQAVQQKVVTTAKKSMGGGIQPPPSFTWTQTIWTFIGSFVTLLMLTRLNVHVTKHYGPDYSIVLGPFGALVTLLYGLTAAPASQPRNAMLGQALSLTISLSLSYADGLAIWMKQSLSTSLAVAAMVKLGLTHPPAGASALLFASGVRGWGNFAFMLVGNIIAIGMATLINNMSDKRQYPMFWGVSSVVDRLWKPENRKKVE